MAISRFIQDLLNRMKRISCPGIRNGRGQTLVEYALLLLLIAVVVVFMIKSMGATVNNTYCKINGSIPS
jgi:Flp pilus assembly pilin Flp